MAVKYLVSGNGGDHLPYTDADGKPDHRMMGAAWAALFSPNGFQGNRYNGPDADAAKAKLRAVYKSEGVPTPDEASSHAEGLDGKWMEVFRAGDYGQKGSYSSGDLDSMISNYDPAKHEAPAVLGHPQDDAPAYGWVEGLKRDGDVLLAKFTQLQPQFEDLVKSGRYKKRSISFYRQPDGSLSLRHVGFLGAMPPEVKGLADVKFRDAQFEAFEFTHKEDEMDISEVRKTVRDSVKEFFAELFGKSSSEGAAKTFTETDLKAAVEAAVRPFKEEIGKVQTSFADLQKKHAEAEKSAAAASIANLAESSIRKLKDAKKWIPAFDKMGLAQIFAELAKSQATVEFGEGDKKTQKPMVEVFADFLCGMQEIVPSRQVVTDAARGAKRGGKLVQFTEPESGSGSVIDQDSVELAEAAKALADKDNISFGEALTRVRRERSSAGAA